MRLQGSSRGLMLASRLWVVTLGKDRRVVLLLVLVVAVAVRHPRLVHKHPLLLLRPAKVSMDSKGRPVILIFPSARGIIIIGTRTNPGAVNDKQGGTLTRSRVLSPLTVFVLHRCLIRCLTFPCPISLIA